MRKFILLAMCALVSGLAFGQHNYYYFDNDIIGSGNNYIASDGILTQVVISDYFSGNTYLVSINKEKREISVAQLSGSNPQTLSNYTVSNIQLYNYNDYYVLNGGFIDPNGDIVVYGAMCNGTTRDGVMMKLFASSGYTSVAVYYTAEEYKDGCFAYRNADLVYFFASSSNIWRIKSDFSNIPGGINNNKKIINGANDLSLSYDYTNNSVVVSGCSDDEVLLLVFDPNAPTLTTPTYSYRYHVPTNYILNSKTNAVDIDGNWYYSTNTAYIVQDVRHADANLGGIWVLEVDWTTGSVISSYINVYGFNMSPIHITGVANNFDNLFVLCNVYGSKILVQIDLYNLSSFVTRKVWNQTVSSSSLYGVWTYSDVLLNNITYDHYTGNVIAAGALDYIGCISDSYTLTSSCDASIQASSVQMYPTNSGTVSTIPLNTPINYVGTKSSYRDVDCYLAQKVCSRDEEEYLSREEKMKHIQDIIASKTNDGSEDILPAKNLTEPSIKRLDDFEFSCEYFSGEISYTVYDVVGRVVCEGHTTNGISNYIRTNDKGLFLIRATDESGNTKVYKIFIK